MVPHFLGDIGYVIVQLYLFCCKCALFLDLKCEFFKPKMHIPSSVVCC